MDYILTDDEREKLWREYISSGQRDWLHFFASAQRKKLLGYIKSRCTGRTHLDTFGRRNIAVVRRHDCPECMVELLKAHGIE